MITKGLIDEVFVIRELDLIIKIHSIISSINQYPEEFVLYEAPLVIIKSFVVTDRISRSTVMAINDKRRDQPLIITNLHNQSRVIDGNHRLIKREVDGFLNCYFYLVPPEKLINFSVPISDFKTERRYIKWKKQVFGEQLA